MKKFLIALLILAVVVSAGAVIFKVVLPDLGHTHNLTKVDKIEATCTEPGRETYYACDGCDQIFSDVNGANAIDAPKAIAPLGHKIVGVAGSDPDCTNAGVKDCYKCTRCDQLFADAQGNTKIDAAEEIPALSHTLVKVEAKAVSCTEDGNNEYWVCSVCSKVFADENATVETTVAEQTVVSDGHSLTKTDAKDATCTEDGNIAYWTCGSCKLVFANAEATEIAGELVISAKGHTFNETLLVNGAITTYEPGAFFSTDGITVYRTCSCGFTDEVNGYTYDKTDALAPKDTAIVFTYVDGEKTYTATIAITVIHVHTTGDQIPAVAPNCTDKGSVAYYECTACKAKFEDKEATKPLESIEVDALGHSGVKTDAVAATCTTTGNIEYWTCSDCGLIFADETCVNQISIESTVVPTVDHSIAITYDENYHWNYCVDCNFTSEKEKHNGFAYPGEAPTCTVCGGNMGDVAGWDGWVQFRPGIKEVTSGVVTSASHVNVNGILASKYVFGPAGAGAESTIWTMSDKSAYKAGQYQVRVPTVSSDRYIYLYVSNDGNTAVSFRIYSENYGDKGGVDVTLGAGESGWFKYTINTGHTVGSNMNIKLLSNLESETAVTIYGYFYLPETQITNLHILNHKDIKLSYEVGEKFNLPELLLGAYILDANGNILADGSEELYYIASNYTVSGLANGQLLTEAGSYKVTVSFGGKTVELEVTVSSHAHNIVYVPYGAASCDRDGNMAHYMCDISGCGQLFADAEGMTPISADSVVIAKGHLPAQLPGTAEYCTRCGAVLGTEVMSGEHWVIFRPEIAVGSGSFPGWKAEYTDVDGKMGSMFTFGAGVNAGDRISLTMWNEQGNFQTIIPNGLDADVANRKVIMYYHNYGTEPITLKFQNDSNASIYDEVTIPAGGVVVSEFDHPKSGGGSNWFYLQVQNDIQTDVTVGVYGYFYLANEFDSISIVNNANKLSFVEGDVFTAEGLMLKTSGGIKTTFVGTGYTTNLDGKTLDKAGKYTVEVSFGGKTVTYDIEVAAHKHQTVLVEGKAAIPCTEAGVEDYYRCTVAGCGEIFSDAEGNNKIAAPVVIPMAHYTETIENGKLVCSNCKSELENWVFYNITTNYGVNSVVGGKIEAADIDGISGSMIYIGAGTAGGKGANFQLCMSDNDAGKQTVIPNLGSGAQSGELRHVIIFYKNYGTEDITLNLQNDAGGGNGSITIPAGETAICRFDVHNVGGSNWFNLYIDSDVNTDTKIGVYGFIYVNDSEVGEISIAKEASKTTFKVGEGFSADGLAVNARIPSSNTKTVYATTGYTTNLDGVVFEKAGEYEVIVSFGGKTASYTVTVTE